jgi:hypothetical protein
MMTVMPCLGALGPEAGAKQSSCGESEALSQSSTSGLPIGPGYLDIRGCEFPAALRGTDMNWYLLHILQF